MMRTSIWNQKMDMQGTTTVQPWEHHSHPGETVVPLSTPLPTADQKAIPIHQGWCQEASQESVQRIGDGVHLWPLVSLDLRRVNQDRSRISTQIAMPQMITMTVGVKFLDGQLQARGQ